MFVVDPSGIITIAPAANDTPPISEAEQKERFAHTVEDILANREARKRREFSDFVYDALKGRKP